MRVSSVRVNYPNICIWVSLQKAPPTLPQPNSSFIWRIIVNSTRSMNSINTSPSILPLSYKLIFLVCLPDLFQKQGSDPFSKFSIHNCCSIYTVQMSFIFLSWCVYVTLNIVSEICHQAFICHHLALLLWLLYSCMCTRLVIGMAQVCSVICSGGCNASKRYKVTCYSAQIFFFLLS